MTLSIGSSRLLILAVREAVRRGRRRVRPGGLFMLAWHGLAWHWLAVVVGDAATWCGVARAQRRDDAGQVGADGEGGLFWPPVTERVKYGQVLGDGHLGPPGPQRELELVPAELTGQPVGQGN